MLQSRNPNNPAHHSSPNTIKFCFLPGKKSFINQTGISHGHVQKGQVSVHQQLVIY
jgi:hypothetical protein